MRSGTKAYLIGNTPTYDVPKKAPLAAGGAEFGSNVIVNRHYFWRAGEPRTLCSADLLNGLRRRCGC